MNQHKVMLIPATSSEQPSRFLKKPGKYRVFGYAKVKKGTGAGVQIRKNIRRLIAEHVDWELIGVSTDYCETENQNEAWKNFFKSIRSG